MEQADRRWEWRRELRYGLEVVALTGFVVVQPLLEVIGDSPDFLLFRKATTTEIVLLTVAVALLPPLVLWGVGALTSLAGTAVRRAVHVGTLALLLLLLGIQALKDLTPLRGLPLLSGAVMFSAVVVVFYLRRPNVQLWFRYASPAPVIFAALFLGFSPISNLVLPGGSGVGALSSNQATAPVVMVLLDEFPLRTLLNQDGRIEERLFPNFARTADDSTWFRNATAVVGFTPHAVPSLLTGRMPEERLAPAASQYPDNLFTLLGESHAPFVFESVTAMCPTDLCANTASFGRAGLGTLVADSADVWRRIIALDDAEVDPVEAFLDDETVAETEGEADGDESADGGSEPDPTDLTFGFGAVKDNQPARHQAFLESIDGTGRPLHFLHLLLPHGPYRYLPTGQQYDSRNFLEEDGEKTEEAWPWVNARHRLLLQTMYTDHLLGQILDRLEASGLYDRALVVVTADHGISRIPGLSRSSKSVGEENAHEVAWVPLFIKAPGQTDGEIRDDNAMLIDVLPTVADILGVEVPWEVDGVSLADGQRTTGEKLFVNSLGAGPVVFDARDHFDRVLDGTADRLVAPGAGAIGLFRTGPHASLVGRDVSEFDTGTFDGAVRLDGADDYEAVDPSGSRVPAIVSGAIIPGDRAAEVQSVVVAVNGVVAGSSEVFSEPDRSHAFVTMVAPQLFERGSNEIDVYVVDGPDHDPRLLQLRR